MYSKYFLNLSSSFYRFCPKRENLKSYHVITKIYKYYFSFINVMPTLISLRNSNVLALICVSVCQTVMKVLLLPSGYHSVSQRQKMKSWVFFLFSQVGEGHRTSTTHLWGWLQDSSTSHTTFICQFLSILGYVACHDKRMV
jgi:hypothetical protein